MNTMRCAFTATYLKQGKWYLAWVEEVPGVNTQGRTLKEAKRNLREALRLIIQTNRTLLTRELRHHSRKRCIREPVSFALPA